MQPILGNRDNTDMQRTVIGRQHGRLDLDPGAIGTEGRVGMVAGGGLVSGGKQHHFAGLPVDQV